MTASSIHRSRRLANRAGSALVLVLIMTLSLAGLAISAIYLSSSAGLLTRYYDRERNYRYAAEAALALGKSRVNADPTMTALPTPTIPDTGALKLINGGTLTDAGGTAIPTVRVNVYVGFTGDTVGRFGNFITLLSQAYDSGGTRHVRRLDLASESFSRFAMFVNTFSSGLAYGPGEFIRGRAHSNQGWYSTGSPGPTYYDTVSAVTTVNGTATYTYPSLPGSPAVPFPTVAKLAALATYASTANLQFTPVVGTGGAAVNHTFTATVDISGRTTAPVTPALATPFRGTRVRFRATDVNNDGTFNQEEEGMMMVFDEALGMDTSAIRADLIHTGSVPNTSITMMNQCGLLVKIAGRNEFFPVARFREQWVRARVRGATTAVGATAFTDADTAAMGGVTTTADSLPTTAAINKIMSYNTGNSRCYPVGSPYLMLTERYVTTSCVVTTDSTISPYAWGSNATGGGSTPAMTTPCASSKQYGGQDTTFTATVTRCAIFGRGGYCKGGHQAPLGAWRTWAGVALPAIAASVIQAVEVPYLWPLYKPYNLNSKGVINATTGPIYLGGADDLVRGNVTFYQSDVTKNVVFIDDLVYDQDPTLTSALCRNFLGIIAGGHVLIADNALNRPRPDASGVQHFYGFPNFTLHAVTMSLTGTVGMEDGFKWTLGAAYYPSGPSTPTAVTCGAGNTTSGGCINQTGGVIEQVITPTFAGANTGMRENRTVDPCQRTNRKPPFFPSTGRYLDNKYYEIDPVNVDTYAQVSGFFTRLRGRSAP